jgi:hypothetical protein
VARILAQLISLSARVLLRFVLALTILSTSTPVLAGQARPSSDAPMPFQKGAVEISALGGATVPVSLFRANPDRNLKMASLQIGRVMSGGPGGNNLQLTLDVTPFFQVHQPDAVLGWSISPLFVRWNFPPAGNRGARIFAEVAGGLLFTSEPVPVRTTTFNFLDQAGFGVRIEDGARRAWLIGYRFQHISNGGRVKPNPGANFNFVYAGVSFLRQPSKVSSP